MIELAVSGGLEKPDAWCGLGLDGYKALEARKGDEDGLG